MPDNSNTYLLSRGERAVFAEIYFPKKGVYQGVIFDALEDGLDEKKVKTYLKRTPIVEKLLIELKDYHNLLNPRQYEESGRTRETPVTVKEARERINMYKSPFKGWSMNEVDGVWMNEDKLAEERTQIIRIMFRLPSAYTDEATKAGCFDVLRSILFWCIPSQGNPDEYILWDKSEQERFITYHKVLTQNKKKLAFAEKYFIKIVKEVDKWRDDCALFVFGYLVKNFAEQVIREKTEEEEIWVASFFNLTLNIFEKVKQPTQP